MNALSPRAATVRFRAVGSGEPESRVHTPMILPGRALLALAMSLRARGLRGLDVLRRSQDRAPPAFA